MRRGASGHAALGASRLEVRLRLLEDGRRAVGRLLRLELGEGDPHLDVLGAVEQRAVQRAGALRLALRRSGAAGESDGPSREGKRLVGSGWNDYRPVGPGVRVW